MNKNSIKLQNYILQFINFEHNTKLQILINNLNKKDEKIEMLLDYCYQLKDNIKEKQYNINKLTNKLQIISSENVATNIIDDLSETINTCVSVCC